MLHNRIPVIVEGKYDKARLAQVISGPVITTEGFGIFNNAEKTALIRKLGESGVILLCDSDGGGKVIRGYLTQILPKDSVYNLYVPQVAGKERRKRHGSKAGFLGVEGIDNRVLEELFLKLREKHPELFAPESDPVENPTHCGSRTDPAKSKPVEKSTEITKTDLYLHGLTGGENASSMRDALCRKIGFPAGMNAGALLTALNILYTREDLDRLCADLSSDPADPADP
ncbi:MAG: DUF4093 domain-containing protein [Clostridia bacterium]|nr:DUF4093 domain-containing protein [Clostridia bacterium]